jgi:RNA recognition motif-containing protein
VASLEDLQPVAMGAPMRDPAADDNLGVARASGPPCRLFVGGLSWDTEVSSLRAFFDTCGEVVDALIVTNRDTGESRGFGFVTMADRKAGARAVKELDGVELDGRALRINLATERPR